MDSRHRFAVGIAWTPERGTGTSGPRDYHRAHVVTAAGKPAIEGSAARVFHGDADRWNPEELLVAALAQCHMLSLFYVATRAGVVVTGYEDAAEGVLATNPDGSGAFVEVVLRPRVTVAGDPDAVAALHDEAHRLCFIAASVAFPVRIEPRPVVTG